MRLLYHDLGGGSYMNSHYNQNYTREEIDAVLSKIKSCVEKKQIYHFIE